MICNRAINGAGDGVSDLTASNHHCNRIAASMISLGIWTAVSNSPPSENKSARRGRYFAGTNSKQQAISRSVARRACQLLLIPKPSDCNQRRGGRPPFAHQNIPCPAGSGSGQQFKGNALRSEISTQIGKGMRWCLAHSKNKQGR